MAKRAQQSSGLPWTPAEDAIVLAHDPRVAEKMLVGRSRGTIRARRTKLRNPDPTKTKAEWTPEKIEALSRHWPEARTTKEIRHLFPGLTVDQINLKARALKLRRDYQNVTTTIPNGDAIDRIRSRATAAGLSFSELDDAIGTRRYFGEVWKRRREINLSYVADAIAFLGGAMEINVRWIGPVTECRGRLTIQRKLRALAKAKAPAISRASYPIINAPARVENEDIRFVRDLVSAGTPGRDDICQEILLALWEGKTTHDALRSNRANVRTFVRRFHVENQEGSGYALSLDIPMRDGRSWHDVLPDQSMAGAYEEALHD